MAYHAHAEGGLPAYFDEDASGALDPAMLEADMQNPGSIPFRKDSFANSNGVLSPAESHGWDQHYPSDLPIESSVAASYPYREQNNGFLRHDAPRQHPHPSNFGKTPHGQSWGVEHPPGNCTPTVRTELMPPPPPVEEVSYHQPSGEAAHANYVPQRQGPHAPQHFHASYGEPGFLPAPQVQTPMSPHSHADWMGMAQQEMECRPLPKRMRPNSPQTMVDIARRDGIRKRNGRIDIPSERNINTIDELIEKATDEDLIKELKQQKRLLRNREAALASRQRKKKHTEDLEVKEKSFTQQISMLEQEVKEFAIEQHRCDEERQALIHRLNDSQRRIEGLQEDIQHLKMQHNEETSSLRRRINVLTDQLAADSAPAMSAAPSSTGFTDFNAEMEALNMGPHEWDDFLFVDNLQPESPDDFTFNPRRSPDTAPDQPIASGLLFMLLLCGAFVLSKPATSRPSDLPNMPPEVQAAAPTVLNNLLAEAGGPMSTSQVRSNVYQEPQPSVPAFTTARAHNRLDRMHQRLTAPSKQQEIDQAFSLTTAQYASIAQADYPAYDVPQPQEGARRPRRNLAEKFASMQQANAQSSKAEVYTRSLLWDQIPTDVVKQFREMVRDHEEIEARQKKRAGPAYKAEP
ncbi:hypothetical protein BAUCODRAFT_76038 [Baudoinia panamericana UAMH 10762]|uniref:BZIP domain-containing protein n=1 Tax=Baudoinia panamericana (strain UAMH 10762) TaxID=717646 RepID=M2MAU2_BAUPA|nr:uncharacterized protein BAUCODRAFT_76038 [Baudoinia panamericana UAMH 10762]EMC93581.1 hypothetical protein BAUCODRAFT_76038 [Baudoinia panamericana UAMH 10762]